MSEHHDFTPRWDVRRLVCDPPKWQSQIDDWADKYGEDHASNDIVIEFLDESPEEGGLTINRFLEDLTEGLPTRDEYDALTRHALNALKAKERGHWVARHEKEH